MGGQTCYLKSVGRRQPLQRVCFPSPFTDYRSRVKLTSWSPKDPLWLQYADLFLSRLPYVNANTAMHANTGIPNILKQYSKKLQRAVEKRQMVEAWRLLVKEGGVLPPFLMCDQLSQIIQFSRGHLDAGSGNSRLAEWYHKKGALHPVVRGVPLEKQLKPGSTVFYVGLSETKVPWVPSPFSGAKDYPKTAPKPAASHTRIRWEASDKKIQDWKKNHPSAELKIYHSDTVVRVNQTSVEVFSTGAYKVKDAEITRILGAKSLSGRKKRSVAGIQKWLSSNDSRPKYYVGYLPEKTIPWWAKNLVRSVSMLLKMYGGGSSQTILSHGSFRNPGGI
jgi:hypothetical protein